MSDYVGFVDSDTIFITKILPRDLFDKDKPVVRALFGKPKSPYTGLWTESSTLAIGMPEPLNCIQFKSFFQLFIKQTI